MNVPLESKLAVKHNTKSFKSREFREILPDQGEDEI